jgi:hypothetical protein
VIRLELEHRYDYTIGNRSRSLQAEREKIEQAATLEAREAELVRPLPAVVAWQLVDLNCNS